MKNRVVAFLCLFAVAVFSIAGCGKNAVASPDAGSNAEPDIEQLEEQGNAVIQNKEDAGSSAENNIEGDMDIITLNSEVMELESGLKAVRYDGAYGFEEYLAQGGASSDADVVAFLMEYLGAGTGGFSFGGNPFGCSTISVRNAAGEWLFGRNFDWNRCDAMIVKSVPESGYASISTVNMDFIQGMGFSRLPNEMQAVIALYAPLDGMNEKGLAVSVNMIQDNATIAQNTEKPDITTTTAVRMLLNQAADTEEAVSLLDQYDMNASMGYMVHFAIADAEGNSVAVEYVDNKMVVTQTPVVTNFYLAEGEKNGIGTAQSHTRYEMLTECLKKNEAMSAENVRDALGSVSKGNFGEFESTEWSAVFNQSTGEVRYYHREDYENCYIFKIGEG